MTYCKGTARTVAGLALVTTRVGLSHTRKDKESNSVENINGKDFIPPWEPHECFLKMKVEKEGRAERRVIQMMTLMQRNGVGGE